MEIPLGVDLPLAPSLTWCPSTMMSIEGRDENENPNLIPDIRRELPSTLAYAGFYYTIKDRRVAKRGAVITGYYNCKHFKKGEGCLAKILYHVEGEARNIITNSIEHTCIPLKSHEVTVFDAKTIMHGKIIKGIQKEPKIQKGPNFLLLFSSSFFFSFLVLYAITPSIAYLFFYLTLLKQM